MTRDVRFRVDVLRNGAPITHLQWDTGSAPQIIASRDATIHTSIKGTFLVNDAVDYLSDEFQPVMTIDGQETPLGIYQAATPSIKGAAGQKRVEVEAYDRCWRVYSNRTETILHLSSYLTIVNDLLAEINYNSLWFDASGVARLEPYQEPSAQNIDWSYGTTDLFLPDRHPGPNFSDEEDIFDAPNVFICVCSNPDLEQPMVATAVNDNPQSRKSTFRRNMRIASLIKVDNIASQEELQAYADRMRNESLLSARAITFYTLNDPGHGIGDVLALTHDDIGGIYLETGWQMQLSAGSLMTHSAKRTVIA